MAAALPKVAEYVKNLGKSVKFSAVEYMKNTTPNMADFMETNNDLFKETFSVVKDYKNTFRKTKRALEKSKVGEALSEGKKALFEDLRTGKFYNADRIEKFEMRSMGDMGDFSDGWDFGDFDIDDIDANDDFAPAKITAKSNKILSQKLGTAIDESTKANVSVTVKSAGMLNDSIVRGTELMFAQTSKLDKTLNMGFSGIREDLGKLTNIGNVVQAHAENARTFYEESLNTLREMNAMMKETTEMQRNLYKAQQKRSDQSAYQNVVTASGMPDLKEYAKQIGKNLKNIMPPGFDMIFGNSMGENANLLMAFVGSPLKFLPDLLVKTIVPATIKKTLTAFDEGLSGVFSSVIAGFNNMIENGDSPILQKIGEIFGLKVKRKTGVNTANYKKDAIPFDGVTKKAITETIPGYLARIESALTGQEERIYDYGQGRWTNIRAIKADKTAREKYAVKSASYDARDTLDEYIADLKRVNTEQAKHFEELADNFFKKVYDDNGSFSLRDRDKEGRNDTNGTKAWEYYGFDNKKQFDAFVNLMRGVKPGQERYKKGSNKNIYKMAGEMLDARERLSSYYEDAEISGLSPLTHLYNNSFKLGKIQDPKEKYKGGNFLTNATDQYKKNIFYYLQNMLAELTDIREMGISSVSTTGRRGRKGKGQRISTNRGNPMDRLRDRLISEMPEEKKPYRPTEHNSKTVQEFNEELTMEARLKLLEEEDKKHQKKKASDKDEDKPLVKRLLGANNFVERWKIMQDEMDGLMKKPAAVLTSLIGKADKQIFNLVFGSEDQKQMRDKEGRTFKGTLDYIITRTGETFDKFNEYLHEKILDPFMEWFKQTKVYAGLVKAKDWVKDKARPVTDAIKSKLGFAKDTTINALRNTYGKGFATVRDGVVSEQNRRKAAAAKAVQERYDTINGSDVIGDEYDRMMNYARGGYVTKGGLTMISPGEIIIPASNDPKKQNRQLRQEKAMQKKYFPFLKTQFNAKGNMPPYIRNPDKSPNAPLWIRNDGSVPYIQDAEEGMDTNKIKETTKKVIEEVSPNAADLIADGLLGGGVSLITGMIGGPILGAAAGVGFGLIKHSEFLKQKLFGKELIEEDDGEGGTLKYRSGGLISSKFQKNFQKYFPSMRDFGIAGGITALFTPLGIVPGIMIGGALGFLKRNDQFNDFLFGKKDENGERSEGGLIKKEFRDKVKKVAPRMLVGAAAGALLGPFGLLGNAALGSALGFATTTETFHTVVFGREGQDGKRHGGLVGKLKKAIDKGLEFGKKHILKPLKDFAQPFFQMIQNAVIDVKDGIKDTFSKIIENTIGRPMADFIQHKIFGNILKFLKVLLFLPLQATKATVAAPFHMLGWVGNNIRNTQIRKGTATNMTAKERMEWRNKHNFRGIFDPRWDRFAKLDKAMANVDEGAKGTEQLKELRNQLKTYIDSGAELGPEGAKLVREAGKTVSEFFNLKADSVNPEKSLYETVGYKAITDLHKNIKYGDINGVQRWFKSHTIGMSSNKHARMTEAQANELYKKIEKTVINIGEIRRKQKEEKKTRRKGKSKLAWASGGALTSTKQLRRYLRNLDTEIDVRTAREKAADKAMDEAEVDPTVKPIVNQTTKITDILTELNERIAAIQGDVKKSTETEAERAKREAKEEAQRRADQIADEMANGTKDMSDAMKDIISGDGDGQDGDPNSKRNKYTGRIARLFNRRKNRKQTMSAEEFNKRYGDYLGGDTTTSRDILGGNKKPMISPSDFSSRYGDYLGENGNPPPTGSNLLTGAKNKIRKMMSKAFHTVEGENGEQAIADAKGNILSGPAASKVKKFFNEKVKDKLKNSSLISGAKDLFTGGHPVAKLLKGAKNGLFGLISSIASSNNIVFKVLKGLFFGLTGIAVLGHGSQLVKNIAAKAKESPVVQGIVHGIKKVGSGIWHGLQNLFPSFFGEDGVIGKAVNKIVDFFDTLIHEPGQIFKRIFEWYKEGFALFKTNLLDPFIDSFMPKLMESMVKALKTWIAGGTVTNEDHEYQVRDEQGNKLYKDANGNITTSAVGSDGTPNEAVTDSVNVRTTSYGDEDKALSKIRQEIGGPKDSTGRNVDYTKEATKTATGEKFILSLSATQGSRGECIILNQTTEEYIRLSDYSAGKYRQCHIGKYYDKEGNAICTGTTVGLIVGAVAVAAIIAACVFTAGSLAVAAPAILKVVAAAPVVLKASTAAGGIVADRVYECSGSKYAVEYGINLNHPDIMTCLVLFGITGIDDAALERWPEFATSTQYEQARLTGSSDDVKDAQEALKNQNYTAGADNTTTYEDVSTLSTLRDTDKIKLWSAIQGKCHLTEVTVSTIKNTGYYEFVQMYRTNNGDVAWYDTRLAYNDLPPEIQKLVGGADNWEANNEEEATESYPTNVDQSELKKPQQVKNSNSKTTKINLVPKVGETSTSTGSSAYDRLRYMQTTQEQEDALNKTDKAWNGKYVEGSDSITTTNIHQKGAADTMNSMWGSKSRHGRRSGKGEAGHLYQNDPSIKNRKFGNETIGEAGCGPVAAANMLNKLSSANNMPTTLDFTQSIAQKYIDQTGGTTTDFFSDVFGKTGLSTSDTENKSTIEKGIKSGVPSVLVGNSGKEQGTPFGAGDHYINVYGTDKSGNAIVEDPDLPESRVKYPIRKLLKDTKHATFVGNSRSGRGDSKISYNEENAKYIYSVLHNMGLPDTNIAGVIGNFGAESGVDPTSIEGIYSEPQTIGSQKQAAFADLNNYTATTLFNMYAKKGTKINRKAYKGADGKYYPGLGLGQFTGPAGYALVQEAQKEGHNWYDMGPQMVYAVKGYRPNFFPNWGKEPSASSAASTFLRKWEGNTSGSQLSKRQAIANDAYSKFSSWPTNFDLGASFNAYGGTTTVDGAAQDNSAMGQITQMGRKVLTKLYGSDLVDALMGSGQTATTGDGSSGGGMSGTVGTSDPSSTWVWPIPGNIASHVTSRFGPRNVKNGSNPHKGIDIGGGLSGKPIIAVAPGTVEKVVNSVGSPRGKYVQIKHQTSTGQTMHVIYQHNMKNNPLNVGDTVKQGQTIAWVGGSGASENSYSPHLHFEVSPTGNRSDAVDPLGFINTSRKYAGGSRSGRGNNRFAVQPGNKKPNKFAVKSNVVPTEPVPKKFDNVIRDANRYATNYSLENLKNIVQLSDGNVVGPEIIGAASRSGRGAGDSTLTIAKLLQIIINILSRISGNTDTLGDIMQILASNGVRVNSNGSISGSERSAKKAIRDIVNRANLNAAKARRAAESGGSGLSGLLDGESTAYIVQVMESIATQ